MYTFLLLYCRCCEHSDNQFCTICTIHNCITCFQTTLGATWEETLKCAVLMKLCSFKGRLHSKYYIIWCLLSGLLATVHLSVSSSIHPGAPEPNGWKETDWLASQPISDLHFSRLVNICALIGRQGRSCAILSGRLFLSVDARRRETNEVIIAELNDGAWKNILTYKHKHTRYAVFCSMLLRCEI